MDGASDSGEERSRILPIPERKEGRRGRAEEAVTANEICPLLKGATAAEAYPVFFYWDWLKNGS